MIEVSKNKLMAWVDEQDVELSMRWVLERLASFAGADRLGWSPVPFLMKVSGLSERKIRYIFRDLEAMGLIEKTDRVHRLEDSTRSVPLYKIAPNAECFKDAKSMGARGAPIGSYGCTEEGGMGAQGVHPQEDPIDPNGETNVSPQRARETDEAIRAAFVATEMAYPRQGLTYTNRAAAWAAFLGLAEQGVDVLQLPDCAARFAASPDLKKRSFPVCGLERWLGEGRYRGSWMQVGGPGRGAATQSAQTGRAPEADQAIWRSIMEPTRVRLGDGPYGSYLGVAYLGQDAQGLVVVAASGVGRDWINTHEWRFLAKAWTDADPQGRSLRLLSKTQFEAGR